MDGILALCHFCESHGPCVILCTQRSTEEPVQAPHSLTVPWCEACQSIDLGQALVSRDSRICYVTTRTPMQQDLAFLLKQAAVRSLSCEEETSKEGGTLYFGDSERGHVISHTFTVQDSLARGFHRKYSILMLMRDKVHLLNSWPVLVRHMKELAKELQAQAAAINGAEQVQRPQRAVRQAQGSPRNTSRSLSQLTGQPAVFGHVHLWFCWILRCETVTEKPSLGLPSLPSKSPTSLRKLSRIWPEDVFQTACYCILTGCRIVTDELYVLAALQVLLPEQWHAMPNADICKIIKTKMWQVQWNGNLPVRLPSLQVNVEKALKNDCMPDSALEPYINSLVLHWMNTARSLAWTPSRNQQLLQALGVQNHDLSLLTFWMLRCDAGIQPQERTL